MAPALYLYSPLQCFYLSTRNPNPNGGSRLLWTSRAHNPEKWTHTRPLSSSFLTSSNLSPISPTVPLTNPKSERRMLSTTRRVRSAARYAVLGAGFAGLSVAWHLLKVSKCSGVHIDIYDENGIGGGASGVSGGLLHPYSPKVKVLWKGAECWKESLKLVTIAERAIEARGSHMIGRDSACISGEPIILRRQSRL